MLTDVIRLLLFPALMAFAASSDLLTMTISNRLSLALAGGFFLLTVITGMSLTVIGMHLAAATLVLVVCFGFFSMGWIGGGDAKLAAATALWFGFDFLLVYLIYAVAVRRRTDCADASIPAAAAAGPASPLSLDTPAAQCRRRRAVRHRTRGRGACRLSQNRLDARVWHLNSEVSETRFWRRSPLGLVRRAGTDFRNSSRALRNRSKTILTRFRYRSLTIP